MPIHPLLPLLDSFFRVRGAIVLPLLWCLGATAKTSSVQGCGLADSERAEAVVPHETGAFLGVDEQIARHRAVARLCRALRF